MAGLAFSELAGREFPEMKIVIISGHDDFEYARQAISISVDRCLLKPITKKLCWMCLAEIREKIEGERANRGYLAQFHRESQEYVQYGLTVFSQKGAESDWRVASSESMKAVFTEENGYRLLFNDARQKQENQISTVRKFIQQVDYIVLMPISETGWDSALQGVKEAGIPVILEDRMVNVPGLSISRGRWKRP